MINDTNIKNIVDKIDTSGINDTRGINDPSDPMDKIEQNNMYYKKLLKKKNLKLPERYLGNRYDFIKDRYEIINSLGKGAYGNVYKAYDHKHTEYVAIKVLKNTREYVKSFKKEQNCLERMYDVSIKSEKYRYKSELFTLMYKSFKWNTYPCIILKLYHLNLYQAVRKNLEENQYLSIIKDLFTGLVFFKECNIIHGDIKPENILLYKETSFRVVYADFGLSIINPQDKLKKNEYVQTAWYRSPEIILKLPYSYEIDWWSIGVIMYELYYLKPLIIGKYDYELAMLIKQFLGNPPDHLLSRFTAITEYKPNLTIEFTRNLVKIKNAKQNIELTLPKKYKYILYNLLTWEPNKRISPEECLTLLE